MHVCVPGQRGGSDANVGRSCTATGPHRRAPTARRCVRAVPDPRPRTRRSARERLTKVDPKRVACAPPNLLFFPYVSKFVYFLILRFMTYVFLHLAATLCTLLAYYLAYPHVSLFPPSVKILYYSSCLSLLPMFLCCPTYANGVLVLFFNLNLIFSSFITRYLERRI